MVVLYNVFMKICKVEYCNNKASCRGWCNAHYSRWYRHGDPLGGTRFNYGKGWVNDSGYRIINKTREHRLVMEKHLGRRLGDNEDVHHKDGDRLNNAIDNLEVVTKHYHGVYLSGRRKYFKCTVDGCSNKYHANGLCQKHYMRVRRGSLQAETKSIKYKLV